MKKVLRGIVAVFAWLLDLNELVTDWLANGLSVLARRVSLVAVLAVGGGVTYKLATASRNSSGTMSGVSGPYTAGSVISSSILNARFADIEAEITDSASRSGKGGFTSPVRGADGTVTAPTFAFTSETGTGLYRIGSSDLGFSVNQVKQLELTGSLFTVVGNARFANGAVATPSVSFTNDTGSGLYRGGSNDIRMAINGADSQTWTASGTVLPTITNALSQSVSGTASTFLANFFEASLANGNNGTLVIGKSSSSNSGVGLSFTPNATAANSTGCLQVVGQSSTLCVDGNAKTYLGSGGTGTLGVVAGNCTLNGGTPAQCTASVVAGTRCIANAQGTTQPIAAISLATSVSSTTLTVTSGTNGSTVVANFICW